MDTSVKSISMTRWDLALDDDHDAFFGTLRFWPYLKGYLGWYQDGPSLLNIEGIGNIMHIGTPQLPAHNPTQGEFASAPKMGSALTFHEPIRSDQSSSRIFHRGNGEWRGWHRGYPRQGDQTDLRRCERRRYRDGES